MKAFFKTIIILAILILISCKPEIRKQSNQIILKGSDTMKELANRWAEAYMITHPNIAVFIEGGGSASGLEALIKGDIDIAIASRIITPVEASQMAQKYKSIGISYMVAKDALSIYLHPANKVTSLTMPDLMRIFSGEAKNWVTFTNVDTIIRPVIRPASSGTHLFFKKHVLKNKKYSSGSIHLPATNDVTNFVSNHINAIGYGGVAYGDSLFNAPVNNIYPSEENVRNGIYPLTRYLYFYTIDTPSEPVRKFIDFVVSPAGQRIVREVGYIPLWE
jgi:phosphate transport system substrate-binding protein